MVGGGRFGNQLFRYWATKLLCNLYGHEFCGNNVSVLCNPIIVNDTNYIEIICKHSLGNTHAQRDLIVTSYCQDFEIFGNIYRTFVKELMSSSNTYELYDGICINQLYVETDQSMFVLRPKDIVIHVRLDDFIQEAWSLKFSYYKEALGERSQWDRIIIVTDCLRTDAERSYIDKLIKSLGGEVIIHQGTMLEDWRLLRRAKNIIASNSTFAWTALIAGDAEFAVIPKDNCIAHQIIVPIKSISRCIVLNAGVSDERNMKQWGEIL